MEIHECTRCHKRRPCGEPHQLEIWVCELCCYEEGLFIGHSPPLAAMLARQEVWGADHAEDEQLSLLYEQEVRAGAHPNLAWERAIAAKFDETAP